VLDATPQTDEYPDGYIDPDPCTTDPGDGSGLPECIDSEFVFKRQLVTRHRPYLGVRFIFSVLRFGLEAMFVPPGGSSEDVDLDGGGTEKVADGSGFQQQYTLTLGLDF
jgi:hypothetical protein